MSRASKVDRISVDEYLIREIASPTKHEYLHGGVYPIPRGRNAHNLIASNTLAVLGTRLRGSGCEPYNSDTKIRIRLPTHVRFYYPDALVVCRPNSPEDYFQDHPAVVVEVLSRKTRRIDEGEKLDAYLTIPSLAAYLLVEQEHPTIVVYRRTEQGFVREMHAGLEAVIPLNEIAVELPLAEVYDGVEFVPERDDEHAAE